LQQGFYPNLQLPDLGINQCHELVIHLAGQLRLALFDLTGQSFTHGDQLPPLTSQHIEITKYLNRLPPPRIRPEGYELRNYTRIQRVCLGQISKAAGKGTNMCRRDLANLETGPFQSLPQPSLAAAGRLQRNPQTVRTSQPGNQSAVPFRCVWQGEFLLCFTMKDEKIRLGNINADRCTFSVP